MNICSTITADLAEEDLAEVYAPRSVKAQILELFKTLLEDGASFLRKKRMTVILLLCICIHNNSLETFQLE